MKRKSLFCIYLFIGIFMFSNVFSVDINIFGNIKEYSTSYGEAVYVNINCSENLTFNIPSSAKKINFQNKPTTKKEFLINDCNAKNIITYDLEGRVELLSGTIVRVERNLGIYSEINHTYSLFIPISYEINKNISSPKNYKIALSEKKNLINFPRGEVYLIYLEEISDESASLNLAHFKKEIKEPMVLTMMLFTFILGIVLSYSYFRFYRREKIGEVVPSFVLEKEERNILNVIKENPGINQKLIGEKIGFSKARISMYVNQLEEKKLVRRERFGRTYKVFIEKKVI